MVPQANHRTLGTQFRRRHRYRTRLGSQRLPYQTLPQQRAAGPNSFVHTVKHQHGGFAHPHIWLAEGRPKQPHRKKGWRAAKANLHRVQPAGTAGQKCRKGAHAPANPQRGMGTGLHRTNPVPTGICGAATKENRGRPHPPGTYKNRSGHWIPVCRGRVGKKPALTRYDHK